MNKMHIWNDVRNIVFNNFGIYSFNLCMLDLRVGCFDSLESVAIPKKEKIIYVDLHNIYK